MKVMTSLVGSLPFSELVDVHHDCEGDQAETERNVDFAVHI
jgi:hypothetical protein